ncbi:hypothetical protein R5R35_010791 [Gryllus longicercus]|uniref:FXNA-like protease n=1 Tax=Gryllus longicercus TaxID=2509291 RepID=A0AAN9VPJ4_9ORTH
MVFSFSFLSRWLAMYDKRYCKDAKRIRQRIKLSEPDSVNELPGYTRPERYLSPTHPIHLICVLAGLTLIGVGLISQNNNLPTPLMLKDAPTNPGQFIAERAMDYLIELTKLGPRSAGSYENEVLAVNLFKKKIAAITYSAKKIHKISLDIQKPSGAFPLHFLDGMTNVYRNVHNIVVKIGPHDDPGHSVLMNCHFDSVPDSPGGSDDGASCAIMLEIFQIISESDSSLNNNIIFLFNGAEENFLQASHGFITQHPWAQEVRTFVNMEACGAGGKEILFQAGPNHPWIMERYSEVVPYPYASSLAQEIFQSGVIPGDTDFRIFRDFGNISGLDFAWATNGYVYHTRFDNVDQIPLGTLQRTGSNILALVLGLTNGKELSNVSLYKSGNIVFFDFLGVFMIKWSENANVVFNVSAAILSVFSMLRSMQSAALRDVKYGTYLKQFGLSCLVVVISWIVTILSCAVIAAVLTTLGRTMSWFARPTWIFFLYICPTLFVPMSVVLFVSRWQRKALSHSPWILFQIYYDSYLFMWTFLLIVCTVFSIRSGFIALFWTFFPCVGSLVQSHVYKHWRDGKWILYHCGALLLPACQSLYLMLGAVNLYIPIMGRTGSGNHAEIVLAFLTSIIFVFFFSFFIPIIILVKQPRKILSLLGTMFLIAVGLLIFTPLGFPYSGDPKSPAPQRFMIAHTQRVFHDEFGRERNRQSGFWLVDMDLNSPFSVESLVPEIKKAQLTLEDCRNELYCGLPYLIPVSTFIWRTHWLPAPPPHIGTPTTLELVSVEKRANSIKRMSFNVTGPSHMGLMVSPYKGVSLLEWSFVSGDPLAGPNWQGRPTYFVFYGCASDPEPWTFWIDVKDPSGRNTSIDIALSGHFLHGPNKITSELRELLANFPPWTTATSWTASYTSWKF